MSGYKVKFLFVTVVSLLILSCSHTDNSASVETESSSESELPVITSMSEMPNATGPMAGTVQADASVSSSKAAQVGQGIFTPAGADAFGSVAACETFNLLKGSLGVAARLDLSLCYLKYMYDLGLFDEIDIEDGNWHVIEFTTEGFAPQTARAKLRVAKDESDRVSELELFFCLYRGSGGFIPVEYVFQEISEGNKFFQRAVGHLGNFQPDDIPSMYVVEASGELDASAAFTSREMAVMHADLSDVEGLLLDSTITQSPGAFSVLGARAWFQAPSSYGVFIYGAGEMLGDAVPGVASLSMGDGSATYAQRVVSYYPDFIAGDLIASGIESWLGDDLSLLDPASSGPFYADAAAGVLPSGFGADPIPALEGEERWECSDDGAGIVEISAPSDAELNTACDAYNYLPSTFSCLQGGGGEGVCGAGSILCTVTPIRDGGLEDACKDCFPGGQPDENTLQCLLEDVCQGEPDCGDGMTMACTPVETRCTTDVCEGDPNCIACFPGGELGEDTFTCVTDLCGGNPACLTLMIVLCSSP